MTFLKTQLLLTPTLIFAFVFTSFTALKAQCTCNGNVVTNMPGYNTQEDIINSEGDYVGWNYKFQFACMGDPCDVNTPIHYFYTIQYREVGTTMWYETWDSICVEEDLLLTVTGLDYCKSYEFRVSCPCPFPLWLTDPGKCPDQFSVIWVRQRLYPANAVKIKNLEVTNINFPSGAVSLNWDDVTELDNVTYLPQYRVSGATTWTNLPTVSVSDVTITGLELCKSYEFRVRAKGKCGQYDRYSSYSSTTFKVTNCQSKIVDIKNVTGLTAEITWESLVTPDYSAHWYIHYWPLNDPGNVQVVSADYTPFTISGLMPDTKYAVQIETQCLVEPQLPDCHELSPIEEFKTNCEIHEMNDDIAHATALQFNTWLSGEANIWPTGDNDFFRFTPDCDLIEVLIELPGTFPDPFDYEADYQFFLYDENQQPYPIDNYWVYEYYDSQEVLHAIASVNKGVENYIQVTNRPLQSGSEKCYDIKVRPCEECMDISDLSIHGQNVVSFPSQETYYASHVYYGWVENWKVEGPAEVLQISMYGDALVQFNGPGEVLLTVYVTNCQGESASYTMTINSTNECIVTGSYNGNEGWAPLSNYNYCEAQHYQVAINNPPPFDWFLASGSATWVQNGNLFSITQTSFEATFGVNLQSDLCEGEPTQYFEFVVAGAAQDLIEFEINPNPVSQNINIIPMLKHNTQADERESEFEVRIFNQYSVEVARSRGSIFSQLELNMTALPPGNYSVQITNGNKLVNQTVQKL